MVTSESPSSPARLTLAMAALLVGLPAVVAMFATAYFASQTYDAVDVEAQRLYDTHTELVFDSMRQVRALERLQRAGRPLLLIDNAEARLALRSELDSVATDGVLMGHEATRTAVGNAMKLLDRCVALPLQSGFNRARCLDQWQPLEQALADRMEALSAITATSAAEQVDSILAATARAGRWSRVALATLLAMVVALTLALALLVYWPLTRVTRKLRAARRGEQVIGHRPLLRELRWLDEAAVQLGASLQELRLARNELEQAANTDLLTGLANRRRFAQTGIEELDRARRTRSPLALTCIDIDRFKHINDTHGHDGGDVALRALAAYLRGAVRAIDTPARLGGEEFAIIMPLAELDNAAAVAERLRRGIADLRTPMPDGSELLMTASFGVARVDVDDSNLEAALRRADTALYLAKSNGRNRVEVDAA